MARSITFHAWDRNRIDYRVNIRKTGKDKAIILKNQEKYDVSNLRKSKDGMIVKCRADFFPVTLQITCESGQPYFTISSFGQSDMYYFKPKDCKRFVAWIKKDSMPTMT